MSNDTTPSAPATPATPTTGGSSEAPGQNGGAAQAGSQPTNTQAGSQQAPSAQAQTPQAGEPYRVFTTQQELDTFMADRATRAKRAGIKELAKELGFDDPDDFRDAVRNIRGPSSGAANGSQSNAGQTQAAQAVTPTGVDLAAALRVAAKLNLPANLITRLNGSTEEELEADAQSLLAMFGASASAANPATPPTQQRAPGIPPAPTNNQPVTLSRSWMRSNPEWVRQNRAAVEAANREGRIVD